MACLSRFSTLRLEKFGMTHALITNRLNQRLHRNIRTLIRLHPYMRIDNLAFLVDNVVAANNARVRLAE